MSDLPTGWVRCTLGDLTEPERRGVAPASVSEMPYLGLEHVQSRTTKIIDAALASSVRSTSYRFGAGATLYARLRPYLNKVCAPTFGGIGSGEFIIFPPSRHLAPGFLKYLLNQPAFVEFTATLDTGDRPRVNWSGIAQFICMLPPITEQRRIVAVVEEQLSRLDAGVTVVKRVQQNLRRMQAAVLQQTFFTHQELPPMSVDDTIRVVDYRGRTPPFADAGIPHLRSFNVKSGAVNWNGCAYVTQETYDKYMSRGFPEAGDLLFTTEAPMGEVAFAPQQQFCMAQRMMLLKPDRDVWSPEFLMYHLRSPWFQSKLQINATGTTVQGISSRNFRPLKLIAPPLDEQERLVLTIRQELAEVDTLEHDLGTAEIRAQRLRSSILAAAFSGKLVSQDPADEPATVLLEHIAAERVSSNGQRAVRIPRPEASSPDPGDAGLHERRMGIQLMWEDGYSKAEIAETMEISSIQVGSEMTQMRREGWDLPKRHRRTTV